MFVSFEKNVFHMFMSVSFLGLFWGDVCLFLSAFSVFMFVAILAGIINPSALGGSGGMRSRRTSCNPPNPLLLVVLLLCVVVSCLAGLGCCVVAVLFVCYVLCFCSSYVTVLVWVCFFWVFCLCCVFIIMITILL